MKVYEIKGKISFERGEDTENGRNNNWDSGYIYPVIKEKKELKERFFKNLKKNQKFSLYSSNGGGSVYIGEFKITGGKK